MNCGGVLRADAIPFKSDIRLQNRFELLEIEPTIENEVDNQDEIIREENILAPESFDLHKTKEQNEIITVCQKPDVKSSKSKKVDFEIVAEIHNDPNFEESVKTSEEPDYQSEYHFVNMESLAPERLLTIKIKINNMTTTALIDTGAYNNLMTNSIREKAGLVLDSSSQTAIRGLGQKTIDPLGNVSSKLLLHNVHCKLADFLVLDDNVISFPVILGRRFCAENNLIIDMSKRLISKINEDKSRTDIYIDATSGAVSKIVYEDIKVHLAEDVQLTNGICSAVVNLNIDFDNNFQDNLFYEGKCQNSKIEGLSGVINGDPKCKRVFLQAKAGEKQDIKLKKGTVVGTASTLIELDGDEDETDRWNLQELREKIPLDHLSEEQKQKVYNVLDRVKLAFGKDDYDIGDAKVSPHIIELTNNTPIWVKPRPFPDPLNVEIEKQCQELEALDIIEKCDSKWSAPVVPVRKADGSLRLCIDYRKINKVTKPENFPIPNLNDSIYRGHNIKFFSKMDLIKGYYQVSIHKDSRDFTAFSTVNQQYRFKRLSFGLKNSGIMFQKNMQEILSEFMHNRIIVYQDDILIMSETFDEHLDLLERIMTTLVRYGIKVKLEKCEFFRESVSFLGHVIDNTGIRKDPKFIKKIKEYPKPSNITELRRFLGLANFQRKFLENFSTIARPLTALTSPYCTHWRS